MSALAGWHVRLDDPDGPGPLYLIRVNLRMDQREFPGFVCGTRSEAQTFRHKRSAERACRRWRQHHPNARVVSS